MIVACQLVALGVFLAIARGDTQRAPAAESETLAETLARLEAARRD